MQNDHFVSEFILKAFAVDGRVQVFNKKTKQIKSRTPGQICYLRGFTTFEKSNVPPGWDENFLEKDLSKWETEIAPIHKKLVEHRTIKAINHEDFAELVRFSVWLYLCNPATQRMLRKGWTEFHLQQIKALRGEELDSLSLKFFGLLLPHNFLRKSLASAAGKEQLLQSEFLDIILKGAESSFQIVMKNYVWRLDDYKDSSLLLCTSDRPVLLGAPKLVGEVGFRTSEATLNFPLAPDLCLIGKNVGEGCGIIQAPNKVSDPRFAALIQVLMSAKSFNLIIASDISVLPPPGAELPAYIPEVIDCGDKLGMMMR